MPKFKLAMTIIVSAEDSDDAFEMGVAIAQGLSPVAPMPDDEPPVDPVICGILFSHPAPYTETDDAQPPGIQAGL